MKSWKSSPRARFQSDFFWFLLVRGNLKAEMKAESSRDVIQRAPHCCLFLSTPCFDLLWVWPRQCRTWRKRNRDRGLPAHVWTAGAPADEANNFFYACWKAPRSAMGKAFSPGSRRRSLQGGRRWPGWGCSAVARRRDDVWKRHHAPGMGRWVMHMTSLVKSLGRRPRQGRRSVWELGLDVLPILSIVIYGALVRLRLVPFLSHRQCSPGCMCRSLVAMFSAGCKSTPCSVTMAEKNHEVSFE